jgi:hypothetical protein
MSVYHKNSTAHAYLIGKEKLHLRELAFGTVYPLTLSEEGHKIGSVFLTAEYWPIDHKLIDTMWTANLMDASSPQFDKYEFFNDNLTNEFKDTCQFGHLSLELDSLLIPLMSQNYKQSVNETLNAIFMVRIKIGSESNCIFIAAPDRILDPLHQRMTANIDSRNDKVYLEFYDVINETAFDAKTSKNDMNNLKLLALHVFDVKDFAFNSYGQCKGHRVLLPVQTSGNVA